MLELHRYVYSSLVCRSINNGDGNKCMSNWYDIIGVNISWKKLHSLITNRNCTGLAYYSLY